MRTCSVEGCENKHYGKGYCHKHYQQFRRHGFVSDRTKYDRNEIIEYDDYAEIVLYNKDNYEVARAIIDLEYVDVVKKHKWCLTHGYAKSDEFGFLHRLIVNCPDDLVVDHINHNRLDNRISNLRICTRQENCMNSGKRYNSSGVTGVTWAQNRNRWHARIVINGKQKHLGYFKTKEEAIEARRQAEIEYYGEFAPTRE